MITLTTTFNLPAASRMDIGRPQFDDDASVLTVDLKIITAPGTGAVVSGIRMRITNTESDKVARQTTPPVGLVIEDRDRYFVLSTRSTPTGYTDAMNAWKAGATMAARRTALEAHLLSAGHIDASLTGT